MMRLTIGFIQSFPTWGYFDHPPMIAILIKAGTFFFQGELGVRFFIVILNTLTLYIIYLCWKRKMTAYSILLPVQWPYYR